VSDHSLLRAAIAGFVAGVLLGGALGLVLAPATGQTTRARVSYRLGETAASAQGLGLRLQHRVRARSIAPANGPVATETP
jgi:gas vesicle protein